MVCSAKVSENDTDRWLNQLKLRNMNPSLQDDEGFTPLHELALSGKDKIAKDILELDKSLLDKENFSEKTPLEIAIEAKKDNLIKFFKEAGASNPTTR